MGESARVELQVGHLCNNRCVFCISGHLTHLRQAPLIADELLKQQIDGAYANGARHLTFLGGEPTIQPGFVELVRYAAKRGFEQIVVFSNGSRLHRGDLLERLLDTGAHFEFRFSFQGGNAEAHERTTRRKGSFAQLVSSLDAVRAQQQAATVNMCVVRQNFESVTDFPALLVPRGVTHLHLDMIHPDDTPDPRPAALADVIPRYGEVARALRAMASSMPDDFRFNIGNLPFCIAPELAPHIHHGGQPTQTATAAVSGEPGLNEAWNKYEHKQKNKLKLPSCAECQFDVRCSGIFPQYAELYGTEELVPVRTPGAAATQSFEASLADCLSQLPRCRLQMVTDGQGASRLLARLGGSEVWLDPGGTGHAISDRFSLSLRRGAFADAKLVWDALLTHFRARVICPLGEDCTAELDPPLQRVLARLRAQPPSAPLTWTNTLVESRSQLKLRFRVGRSGEIQAFFSTQGQKRRGYSVVSEFEPELLGAVGQALRRIFQPTLPLSESRAGE